MADGLSVATADAALGTITDSPAGTYVALHTGDPGADGTSNPSSVTAREAQAWGSPSSGTVSATDTPTWSSWSGTSPEVDTDISHWDEPTSGTFNWSVQLSSSVTMNTGNTLEITSDSITFPTAS